MEHLEQLPRSNSFLSIERFTALMYKRTTNATILDEERREIFVKDNRGLEIILPKFNCTFSTQLMCCLHSKKAKESKKMSQVLRNLRNLRKIHLK